MFPLKLNGLSGMNLMNRLLFLILFSHTYEINILTYFKHRVLSLTQFHYLLH